MYYEITNRTVIGEPYYLKDTGESNYHKVTEENMYSIASESILDIYSESDEEEGFYKEKKIKIEWGDIFKNFRKEDSSSNLEELVEHFTFTASTIVKMIIGEYHLSDELKIIKPLNKGIAGGEKYKVHGLFFKCPIDKMINDTTWLYGETRARHDNAAKACNHDLKGWVSFMAGDTDRFFQLPLLAIIDYQGLRFEVMNELPISEKTLVYGSSDGGKTIKFNEKYTMVLDRQLKKIGTQLNLRPHKLKDKEIALCGDLEIHRILSRNGDTDYYVLDWARIFPPQHSVEGFYTNIFSSLLRPEYLKKLKNKKISLSSDALSRWQSDPDESISMNEDVKIVSEAIYSEVIPDFVKYLTEDIIRINTQLIKPSKDSVLSPHFNSMPITEPFIRILHLEGLNIRHIGAILRCLEINPKRNLAMESYLLNLMITRACKNYWKNTIQNHTSQRTTNGQRLPVKEVCRDVTLKLLESLLSLNNTFWKIIDKRIKLMFGKNVLKGKEITEIKYTVDLSFIVIRFCQVCIID